MRTVGDIAHPHYKITVLEMNGRLAVKIEDRLMEQTYKFRDGSGIRSLDDVRRLLNDSFMSEVDATFRRMQRAYIQGLEKLGTSEDLPEII